MSLQANYRELERLQKIYPHFRIEVVGSVEPEEDERLPISIAVGGSGTYHTRIHRGRLDPESGNYLERAHMELSIARELMENYPHLYIHAHGHKDGIAITAWVKRNDDDAEAIGHLQLASVHCHPCLIGWQTEAKKACQEGWFFCTGHQRAEPEEEGRFFHFAGRFCKKWGEEHPEVRERARRETYE